MTEQPLNAQQLAQIQANAERQLRQIVEQMNLRKWAVEQVLAKTSNTTELIHAAGEIYDFVVKPAQVKIEVASP